MYLLRQQMKNGQQKQYVSAALFDVIQKKEVNILEFLHKNRITSLTGDWYAYNWQKTIDVIAYAETKEQSHLIDRYL